MINLLYTMIQWAVSTSSVSQTQGILTEENGFGLCWVCQNPTVDHNVIIRILCISQGCRALFLCHFVRIPLGQKYSVISSCQNPNSCPRRPSPCGFTLTGALSFITGSAQSSLVLSVPKWLHFFHFSTSMLLFHTQPLIHDCEHQKIHLILLLHIFYPEF